jgi:hypothetical protein
VHSNPDSHRAADARPERPAPHELPRWVKAFGIGAALAVAALAGLHMAGGGMGHMAHGGMAVQTMPAEHRHGAP